MNDWIERQVELLRALSGSSIVRWQGIEVALRDAGENGLPVWHDASIPFLQLNRLDMTLVEGFATSIITYQNNDRWGLYRDDALPPSRLLTHEPHSIFRSRLLDELPVGRVQRVAIDVNAGDIAEVRLYIEGREIRLWAGEVYEQSDGSLRVVPMDESVLVQVM